jgi:threonine dehydrogenase-like Zn-dependent dehydrogenase
MRVAVLVKPGRIEIKERPIPSPAARDVLVRVSAVGIVIAQLARASGAAKNAASDPDEARRKRAVRLAGADTWPTAISLIESGRVDLDAMVTVRFPLEMAAHALDSDRVPGTVKSGVTVS